MAAASAEIAPLTREIRGERTETPNGPGQNPAVLMASVMEPSSQVGSVPQTTTASA
jgi:hypothetical protein